MSAPAIALRGLTRAFGARRGVFDLDLEVAPGQIFGFLGPNGAGKTTTLRLLLGYLRPDHGEARILGLDALRAPLSVRPHIGYLPAEFNLYEDMTGEALLRYLAGYRPAGTLARAHALAERLGLAMQGRIKHYSRGMKQKLALIQAMMHDPAVLILDEASSGFDPLVQRIFHGLLVEARARGRTVFLSSHLLSEVEEVCDRAAILRDGRLLAVESVADLRARKVRLLNVRFAPGVTAAAVALPGATLREHEGSRASYAVTGTAQALLSTLASLPVEDFSLEPARLEEVFLAYYGAEDAS